MHQDQFDAGFKISITKEAMEITDVVGGSKAPARHPCQKSHEQRLPTPFSFLTTG
jgi:hypothetical protein